MCFEESTALMFCPQGENFPQWAEDMKAAAAHPNVYCKLSGLINEVGEELSLFLPLSYLYV